MKNRIWVLVMMAGMIIGIIACDTDSKEQGPVGPVEPIYTPSDHLGIGEGPCPKSNECGLKSYGKVGGQEIRRFGAVNDTNFTDTKIQVAAGNIKTAYAGISGTDSLSLSEAVQILGGAGKHSYIDGALKIYIDGTDYATFMNDKAHTRSAHRGIGETCPGGDECGLQDYRTVTQKISFPKEIYRYGAKTNYTDVELRDTADKIVAAFEQIVNNAGGEIEARDNILDKIGKLYVVKAANTTITGGYTWDGTDFGADPLIADSILRIRLQSIAVGTLQDAGMANDIIVQAVTQ